MAATIRLTDGTSNQLQPSRKPVMTTTNNLQRTLKQDLAQVIEPLASYICAAERPQETLLSALTVLLDEVEGTNRAALMHVCLRANSLGLAS
jgi:hypothetical protein